MIKFLPSLILVATAMIGLFDNQANITIKKATSVVPNTPQLIENIPPVFAQISQVDGCNASLQNTKNKIEKNKEIKVVQIVKSNISQFYRNYPKNRQFSYGFALAGSATQHILSSERLLATITKEIITNCPSISIVQFAEYRTDNIATYGVFKNNSIEAFKCIDIDPPRPNKLPWGYVVCL